MPRKNVKTLLASESIEIAKKDAEILIKAHEKKDITVIPISSESYPELLRLIPDPPTLLFAKGNLELLKGKKTLAIVGTRKPTPNGTKTDHKIAKNFAEIGYIIVSGLALGIDTAGHEGALSANNGKTIAVLAGSLAEIYPTENKALAQDILEREGLWLTETPLGQANTEGNFVKRDRIQSGLFLGVCPVQTPKKSGTQHTIAFSREQNHFLFTPNPLKQDLNEDTVQGNLALIESGVAVIENKEPYEIIYGRLLEYKVKLKKSV